MIEVGTPEVKTIYWIRKGFNDGSRKSNRTDAELRKHREQKGLETPVVYAVNDVHSLSSPSSDGFGKKANALNVPPGEYSRKAETQRTSRALNRPVEHAI